MRHLKILLANDTLLRMYFQYVSKNVDEKYQLSKMYFHNRELKCEVYPITFLCLRFVLAVCSSSSQEWCAVAIFALRNWIACCTCVALFPNIQKNIVKSRIITKECTKPIMVERYFNQPSSNHSTEQSNHLKTLHDIFSWCRMQHFLKKKRTTSPADMGP